MWMFLGTISGLTFGILEERLYTEMAIAQVANARAVSQADAGVLDFAFRVFVDGFQHAIWAGIAGFFIGIAINYPTPADPADPLRHHGVQRSSPAHDERLDPRHERQSLWPWIGVQAFSVVLFLGYTMSAHSIERRGSAALRCSAANRSWRRTASPSRGIRAALRAMCRPEPRGPAPRRVATRRAATRRCRAERPLAGGFVVAIIVGASKGS